MRSFLRQAERRKPQIGSTSRCVTLVLLSTRGLGRDSCRTTGARFTGAACIGRWMAGAAAAGLEPTDPTVTEHLGDAYWQVGRRIEARFRWRAALAMEPSDKQRKDIAAELDFGLDAAPAMLAAK